MCRIFGQVPGECHGSTCVKVKSNTIESKKNHNSISDKPTHSCKHVQLNDRSYGVFFHSFSFVLCYFQIIRAILPAIVYNVLGAIVVMYENGVQ